MFLIILNLENYYSYPFRTSLKRLVFWIRRYFNVAAQNYFQVRLYFLLSYEKFFFKSLKAHTVHLLTFFPCIALHSASLGIFKMCFSCVNLDAFKSGILVFDSIQVKNPQSGNLHVHRVFLAHWFFSAKHLESSLKASG